MMSWTNVGIFIWLQKKKPMKMIPKTTIYVLLAVILSGTIQSCSKRKCDGRQRTKVPMGYMWIESLGFSWVRYKHQYNQYTCWLLHLFLFWINIANSTVQGLIGDPPTMFFFCKFICEICKNSLNFTIPNLKHITYW